MKNQKTSKMGILGTIIVVLLILVGVKYATGSTRVKIAPADTCENSVSYLFDVEDMSIATAKRQVLTLNVPADAAITFEELKSEAECYALKIFADKKADVVAVNMYWSSEKHKTIKGDKLIGSIKYAPFGDWANDKSFTTDDYQFNYSEFSELEWPTK